MNILRFLWYKILNFAKFDETDVSLYTLTPKNFAGKKFGGINFGHFFDISAENNSDTFLRWKNFRTSKNGPNLINTKTE